MNNPSQPTNGVIQSPVLMQTILTIHPNGGIEMRTVRIHVDPINGNRAEPMSDDFGIKMCAEFLAGMAMETWRKQQSAPVLAVAN